MTKVSSAMQLAVYVTVYVVHVLLVVVPFASCQESSSSRVSQSADEAGCQNAMPVVFDAGEVVYAGTLDDSLGAAYFRVPVTNAGDWMLFDTNNMQVALVPFNAVISIFSSDGTTRLGTMDDSLIWSSFDPFYIFHAPTSEALCVKVESYEGWTESSLGADSLTYQLDFLVRMQVNSSTTTHYEEEDNDATTNSNDISLFALSDDSVNTDTGAWINGTLASADDVDVYSFTTGADVSVTQVYLNMIEGAGQPLWAISGSGSTALVSVEIYDETEQLISSLEMNGVTPLVVSVLAPDTKYFLHVTGAAGWTPGINDYYSLFLYNSDQRNFSFEPLNDNDSIAAAGAIPLSLGEFDYRVARVFGAVSTSDDIDVFSLDVQAYHYVFVSCNAASIGSAVEDFTVRLLDNTGEEVRSDVESGRTVEWSTQGSASGPPVLTRIPGPYYLQFEASVSDEAASNLYSCHVATVPLDL